MATFFTWLQIYDRMKDSELDLEAEDFVDKDEMREYANEAIDEAEALIHTLYEDYFLARTFLSPEAAMEEVALPTDIYANKIRGIVYMDTTDGQGSYEVKRIRDWKKFIKYRLNSYGTGNDGRLFYYFLINDAVGAPKLVFSPPPPSSGTLFECWYIRNANRLTGDSSVCDIPEFIQFVYDHIRVKVYEKENHFGLQKALADKEATKNLMIETLTGMVPDNDNEIEPDLSAYEEMS